MICKSNNRVAGVSTEKSAFKAMIKNVYLLLSKTTLKESHKNITNIYKSTFSRMVFVQKVKKLFNYYKKNKQTHKQTHKHTHLNTHTHKQPHTHTLKYTHTHTHKHTETYPNKQTCNTV